MTRRKCEITARMNESDFPHIAELAAPEGGFGNVLEKAREIALSTSQAARGRSL
jgi:hypothetical protein